MLYLGIDQHARQITISLRDENGNVLLARQVSTQPEKVHAFFQQLTRERLHADESFVAVLEVCGFNDWLIRMLQDYHCHKVILIQPEDRKKCKTCPITRQREERRNHCRRTNLKKTRRAPLRYRYGASQRKTVSA